MFPDSWNYRKKIILSNLFKECHTTKTSLDLMYLFMSKITNKLICCFQVSVCKFKATFPNQPGQMAMTETINRNAKNHKTFSFKHTACLDSLQIGCTLKVILSQCTLQCACSTILFALEAKQNNIFLWDCVVCLLK